MDSPRGRIYQMVQVERGRMSLSESFVRHIDLCLGCLACETACPSGVEYHKLVESARGQIERFYNRSPLASLARRLFFRELLPHRKRLILLGTLLRWIQQSGLEKLAVAIAKRLSRRLYNVSRLAPRMESPFFFQRLGEVIPAKEKRRHRVGFFAGCIANLSFAGLNEATLRVLAINGCEVVIPKHQVCCGALQVHAGVRDVARDLAWKNIQEFEGQELDVIITNAAGCGSVLKDYPLLFGEEGREHQLRAAGFSSRVRDVTEFLAGIKLNSKLASIPVRVTYQDPCHLAHAQQIRKQPRQLLAALPGVEFVELKESDICCGSAGIYNVVQNEMAEKLMAGKMARVDETRAEVILTANPGCLLQLRAGVAGSSRPERRVMHVIELLDEAYQKAEIQNNEVKYGGG